MKLPDVKFLLEQSHSKFYLYHIISCNNLEKKHAFTTHKFSSFQDESLLANKHKPCGILSYNLGTDEL
jgi:hypothetical protein